MKRIALLCGVIALFAAPLAANQMWTLSNNVDQPFERSFSLETDFGPVGVQMKYIGRGLHAKAGIVETPWAQWMVREFPNGERTAELIDPNYVFTERVIRGTGLQLAVLSGGTLTPTAVRARSFTIDILGVYEPSAAVGAGGDDMLYAEVDLEVNRANQIFLNSGVTWLRYRLVGFFPLRYDVPQNYAPTDDPEAVALREQYNADVLFGIVEDYPVGGSAQLFWNGEGAEFGAVVKRAALSHLALAHELGHVLGLDHEEETAGWNPPTLPSPAINRSLYQCFGPGNPNNFGLVMGVSIPEPECGIAIQRLEMFSGEGLYHNGIAVWQEDSMQAQVLEITGPIVAQYMLGPVGPCVPADDVLCVDSSPGAHDQRFEVRINYASQILNVFGVGNLTWTSPTGGLFWFFQPDNPEVLVKVLNGCNYEPAPDHFWVFLTAATNVGFTVTVSDTVTNIVRTFENPDGVAAVPVQDLEALPCE